MKMIVHNGIRYRPEDAKRRGIPADQPDEPKAAAKTTAKTTATKKRTAKNKARTVEDEASGGAA